MESILAILQWGLVATGACFWLYWLVVRPILFMLPVNWIHDNDGHHR